ncbi:MAG: aminoglycoside phosphotransferase family protein [Caldilineaceae bacterium]|nr:aminoglycoside phosphotransferase family protein [Caldilineaceae bacterium]
MIEPPNLSTVSLKEMIDQAYAISPQSLTFLPIGNDATAALFRVDAADGTYLCKLKRGPVEPAGLAVPYHLYQQGMTAVVAPLPTRTGKLATPCDAFTLILYPYIAGETGMTVGLSPVQWQNFGRLLRQLHDVVLPADLVQQLPHESFTLRWQDTLLTLDQRIQRLHHTDPVAQELAVLWRARRDEIWRIVERTGALGQQLQAAPPPLVLCHADIHTANLLVDPEGALHIVDWDGVMLAPKERDLMFVTERANVQHLHEQAFFAGYGHVTIDPVAFAYYRYEWVVQELADYGRRILLRDDLDETSRQVALDEFRQLFAPGDVVDVAYGADTDVHSL